MAGNRDLILAGVAGGGAGTSLAWFADKGATMPTAINTALGVGFKDAGLVTEDGLRKSVDESSNDINAYGVNVPVRTLTTSSKVTFEVAFLESNTTSLAIYNRLALDDLEADTDGLLDFTEGVARTVEYAAVFDMVDGLNAIRAVVPVLQVTDRAEFPIRAGEPVTYGVTLTAYPGPDGVAVHWFYKLNALATP